MKYLLINASHMEGVSKKNGKPYDFTNVTALPTSSKRTGDFNGIQPLVLDCNRKVFESLPTLPALCDCELIIEAGYDGKAKTSLESVKLIKEVQFAS